MNLLTKAFVVVVTVLSVILVTLVVSFVARVDNHAQQAKDIKQDYEARLTKATETANQLRLDIAAKGQGQEDALAKEAELTAELARVNADLKAVQAELSQAEITVDRATAALEIASRDNENTSNIVTKQSEQINGYLATLADVQSQRDDVTQTLIEEKSKVRRLSDSVLRFQELTRSLEQQLLESQAALKIANDRIAAFTEENGPLPDVAPRPDVEIRGSVTQISQLTDDIVLIQVNVGTRDLVQEGMEFTVSRGDEFVGKILIEQVDTAEAVGQLTLGGGVQEGDVVQAGGR